ncbi:hypothetical protein AGR7A_pAt10113 [Agrobacterium deltaense NCPPB 1641]|uniref:Uncharacterized protein n=1 Tax=Agrobacterium deltaense NCPPB 1641 TaxID=1183425 RepID=A0A1S7U7K2_9HYPH|nr:hypothetical protein AGR7A_pAt10113 [Agrobacterium deltaense NCPPB 1641]
MSSSFKCSTVHFMISGRGTTATPLLTEKAKLIYQRGAWLAGKAQNSSVAIIFFVTVEASRNIRAESPWLVRLIYNDCGIAGASV